MDITEYKGYKISLDEFQRFRADKDGGNALFCETYKGLTEGIDRLVKAESKISPIPVLRYVDGWYVTGNITSFNNLEQTAWFVSSSGRREKLQHYDTIYRQTDANMVLVAHIEELRKERHALDEKIDAVTKNLTGAMKIGKINLDEVK